MPNFVFCKLELKVSEDRAARLIDEISSSGKLDFNKLIPIPSKFPLISAYQELLAKNQLKEQSVPDILNLVKEDENDFGSSYDWKIENWGTKANCYESTISSTGDITCIYFTTAWTVPYPVIASIGNKFQIPFMFYYFEEQEQFWGVEEYGFSTSAGGIFRRSKRFSLEKDFEFLCEELMGKEYWKERSIEERSNENDDCTANKYGQISSNIDANSVREAVLELDIHKSSHPYKCSTDYDVIIDNRAYPPVAVMGIASAISSGSLVCPRLKGGLGTDCFAKWAKLGFEIVPKGSYAKKINKPKDSESWPEYLEHLQNKYEFDPINILSLCLRLQPKRSIKRFLGRDDDGDIKQLGSKKDNFSIGHKDWFKTVEIAFTPKQLKLYLVSSILDRNHHISLRQAMDKKFIENYSGALEWPCTGPNGDGVQMLDAKNSCASYVSVSTEDQCRSVIQWLSEGNFIETKSFSF